MVLKKMRGFHIFILLLLRSIHIVAQVTSCADKCGNISIPFPFGIGKGCFLDETYEIACQQNDAIPILKKKNFQVLNISLPSDSGNGMITVNIPVVFSNCTGKADNGGISLEGSQFIFSQYSNVFAAVGCGVDALMKTNDSEVAGCKLECNKGSNFSTCSGIDNCCRATIPFGLKIFGVDFAKPNKKVDNPECKYAFIADQTWFQKSSKDLDVLNNEGYVPAVLEWGISNDSYLATSSDNDNSYYCVSFDFASSEFMPFLQCFCHAGYSGNAYVKDGCKDVCNDPKMSTQGYYHCDGGGVGRKLKFSMIGIGSGIGALLLLLLIWWLRKIIRRRKEKKLKEKYFKQNGGLLLQRQLSSPEGTVENSKLFNAKELQKATDNFNESRILGKGGQGTVYKGMLTDGRIVAIKKAIVMDEGKAEQFINEVIILSQINHRNIVKLLGCCLETEAPLLVYEFIPNGTLYKYLHEPNDEVQVSWEMRLQIAIEIARALCYLHSAASIPIYHRDIKSTNILLDEKYRTKIADFGTSRSVSLDQTHVTTLVHGTFGYLDPEYFQSSQFTDKSDVYSFGVVLVELLTGQKPISSMRAEEGRSLATYYLLAMEGGHLFDILDVPVIKQGKKEEIIIVANLAKRCLHLHGRNRPTMREVTTELEGIKKLRDLPDIQQNYEDGDMIQGDNGASASGAHKERVDDEISLTDVEPLLPSATW